MDIKKYSKWDWIEMAMVAVGTVLLILAFGGNADAAQKPDTETVLAQHEEMILALKGLNLCTAHAIDEVAQQTSTHLDKWNPNAEWKMEQQFQKCVDEVLAPLREKYGEGK